MSNVKFLDTNLIDADCTFTFTSADQDLSDYIYDNDKYTRIYSVGSDDVTDEIFIIEFGAAVDVSRIFLRIHNIKAGKIEYSKNGSDYYDFSPAIALSANTATSNYWEFTTVEDVTHLKLTMNTTMVANAEKYITELRALNDIGTLTENNSKITGPFFIEDSRLHAVSGGGIVKVIFGEKAQFTLNFNAANDTDMALLRVLKNRRKPFYVFLCGGESGLNQEMFRIEDMFLMKITNNFSPYLIQDFLIGAGTNIDVEFSEE